MHVLLHSRDTCPAGTHLYKCGGYQGCCSIDPCFYQSTGCPDDIKPNESAALSSSLVTGTTLSPVPSASVEIFEILTSIHNDHTVYITVLHSPSASAIATPTSTSTPPKTASESNKSPVGAIVGGVVGAATVILLASLLILLHRRKKYLKERRRATIPSLYQTSDMSSQIHATNATMAAPETSEKSGLRFIESARNSTNADASTVPQLDGRMVRPTNEIGGGEVIGVIPELPAPDRRENPFATPVLGGGG